MRVRLLGMYFFGSDRATLSFDTGFSTKTSDMIVAQSEASRLKVGAYYDLTIEEVASEVKS